MPLRYVKKRLTAENALSVAIATTAVTRELADMTQFPPARAAAGLLLLIFQTIQEIQDNRTECYRLASRCLRLLTDLKEAMEGRWDDAPPSLIRSLAKFEKTLQDIYDDLKRFAGHKWHNRLMKKNSIELAIAEYNVQLDDAARSFQITALIDIHYAIGDGIRGKSSSSAGYGTGSGSSATPVSSFGVGTLCESPHGSTGSISSDIELVLTNQRSSTDEYILVSEPSMELSIPSVASALPAAIDPDNPSPISAKAWISQALADHDDRGFRRYHQSDVVQKRQSSIKSGWWAGAQVVDVEGRQLAMLPYTGSDIASAKRWMKDVKILQNIYHPNLPQMVGYSGIDTPTPFILLANIQTRLPQAMVLDAIQNNSLLSCARLLVTFYRDIFDAATYLQRQLELSESKIQDYVENTSFRVDALNTIVMGLPPPEVHSQQSYRNFGLAHSIREIFLKTLPNGGYARRPYDPQDSTSVEMQCKVNHLAILAKALLPSTDDYSVVSSRLQDMLGGEEDEDEEGLTLPLIRMVAIKAKTHAHTWDNNFVPPYMYTVGDVGYIPGGEDFKSFVVLENVIKDGLALVETVDSSKGIHIQWKKKDWVGGIMQQELQSFPAPAGFNGWPIIVSPGDRDNVQIAYECAVASVSAAWQLLLDHAKPIAEKHCVKPEDLILVTRAGVDIRLVVTDLRLNLMPSRHPHYGSFHPSRAPGLPGQFHGHHSPHFGFPESPPVPIYLFTSPEQGQDAFISESPVCMPLPPGSKRPEVRDRVCGYEGTFGFMNYVQLHAEDFA